MSYNETTRSIAVKHIVYSDGWYMCRTNWSKSYSAGVMEFDSEQAAIDTAKERTKDAVNIHSFNKFGERIK